MLLMRTHLVTLRVRYVFHPGFAREIALTLLMRNIFDAQFETNAWSYRYIFDGSEAIDQGYFPQAGAELFTRG